MLAQSLREIGGFRSIAIDADGVVRAGNGVLEQAKRLGMKLRVIDAKPDELVAVRRKDLRGTRAERAALLDNRTAELSEWDAKVLAELPPITLDGIFDPGELPVVDLAGVTGGGGGGGESDTDRCLTVVFDSREALEEALRSLGVPWGKKKVAAGTVEIRRREG
jgi:hypothetical protein